MTDKLPVTLATLQSACKKVEEEMIGFLLQYTPCGTMTVDDIKTIARFARDLSFRSFDAAITLSLEPKP